MISLRLCKPKDGGVRGDVGDVGGGKDGSEDGGRQGRRYSNFTISKRSVEMARLTRRRALMHPTRRRRPPHLTWRRGGSD